MHARAPIDVKARLARSLARSRSVGRSVAGRMARFIFMRDTQQSMALPGLLFIVVYVSVMAAI